MKLILNFEISPEPEINSLVQGVFKVVLPKIRERIDSVEFGKGMKKYYHFLIIEPIESFPPEKPKKAQHFFPKKKELWTHEAFDSAMFKKLSLDEAILLSVQSLRKSAGKLQKVEKLKDFDIELFQEKVDALLGELG